MGALQSKEKKGQRRQKLPAFAEFCRTAEAQAPRRHKMPRGWTNRFVASGFHVLRRSDLGGLRTRARFSKSQPSWTHRFGSFSFLTVLALKLLCEKRIQMTKRLRHHLVVRPTSLESLVYATSRRQWQSDAAFALSPWSFGQRACSKPPSTGLARTASPIEDLRICGAAGRRTCRLICWHATLH